MFKNIFFVILLICSFFITFSVVAQRNAIMNMPEHGNKLYYFGLTFGGNSSAFRLHGTQDFANNLNYKRIQPYYGPGFNVGIMGNLRLNSFIDLRLIPALAFVEKGLETVTLDNESIKRTVESIYLNVPFQLKFKSDRIVNFRFYAVTGIKLDFDMASNSKSRRVDEWIKTKPLDFGAELGIGFEFFYPNFIIAPEIKIGQGFINSNFHDPLIPLSNNIDRIFTRMIVFSLHIQG